MVRELERLNVVIRCTPGDYPAELFERLAKRFTGLEAGERYADWLDGYGWLVFSVPANLVASVEQELEDDGSVFEYRVRRIPALTMPEKGKRSK